MKAIALLSLATGSIVPAAFGQADASRLKGAWELVRYDYGGGTKPPGTTEIKLITDHHFVWVNYDAKGKTLGQGGGRYTFNGSQVVEHLDFADKDEKYLLSGKDQVLVITFNNDTFTSIGALSSGQKIVEVWKRLN